MALQAYLTALQAAWHKTSAHKYADVSESYLSYCKKEEGFKDKDAQAPYDQAS